MTSLYPITHYHILIVSPDEVFIFAWNKIRKPKSKWKLPSEEKAREYAIFNWPDAQEVKSEEFLMLSNKKKNLSFYLQSQVADSKEGILSASPLYYVRTYGMSIDGYQSMYNKQNGLCAICQQPPKENTFFVVDHDHRTGKVRGLLCDGCNTRLGKIEGKLQIYKASLAYLGELP